MQKRFVEPQADETRSEIDKVAAPTRLTAEQFYEQNWQYWDSKRTEDDSFWTTAFALAEAFRDKSEAELQKTVTRCLKMTREADELFKQEMRFRRKAEAELAALRERERWIPVEEKLPEDRRSVQICHENPIPLVHVARMVDGEWLQSHVNEKFCTNRVTHWKALSAAPEAK